MVKHTVIKGEVINSTLAERLIQVKFGNGLRFTKIYLQIILSSRAKERPQVL